MNFNFPLLMQRERRSFIFYGLRRLENRLMGRADQDSSHETLAVAYVKHSLNLRNQVPRSDPMSVIWRLKRCD